MKRNFVATFLFLGAIAAFAQASSSQNEYAYKHWSDWRIFHIGDRPAGFNYVMLYKAVDGSCNLQTLDRIYRAETQKCSEKTDGWGKIDRIGERDVVTIIPTTNKGKHDSYEVNLYDARVKTFHDTLAELQPKITKSYDSVVSKLQSINGDPNAAPDGYSIRLTIDRINTGTYSYQCEILAHSDQYTYELEGRGEADCSNLPAPHQTYWSRESRQSALSVTLLNAQDDQNAKRYVDIVLGTQIDEYHGKVSVKKTTFVITSRSSL